MTDSNVRPSGLPKSGYVFPDWFDRFIQDQLGIVVGNQGFDNNILMAEAFMKVLPQVIIALIYGSLNNPMTQKRPTTIIDQLLVDRIQQIWTKGLYCIIVRDPDFPETVMKRAVAYPSRETSIIIGGEKYKNPWDLSIACPQCLAQDIPTDPSEYVGFMKHGDFSRKETRCFTHCMRCGFEDKYEVEVKPPFQLMNPLRPVTSNPIWVEVSADPLIKYCLEGVDLVNLASLEGGWYYKIGNELVPIFNSFEEILNSPHTTRFPSQKYFHDTINLEYSEFLFYYNFLLVIIHRLITEKNRLMETPMIKSKTDDMEHAH